MAFINISPFVISASRTDVTYSAAKPTNEIRM